MMYDLEVYTADKEQDGDITLVAQGELKLTSSLSNPIEFNAHIESILTAIHSLWVSYSYSKTWKYIPPSENKVVNRSDQFRVIILVN